MLKGSEWLIAAVESRLLKLPCQRDFVVVFSEVQLDSGFHYWD